MRAKLVSTLAEAIGNIVRYEERAAHDPPLRDRAGYARAWYAHRDASGAWRFAPSKFVGYLHPGDYISESGSGGERDGRQSERVLSEWFTGVEAGTPLERELVDALRGFLARLNQVPNVRARISIAKSELEATTQVVPNAHELLSRISSDPRICGGKPCIKGTRMRVVDIVEAIAHGATREDLLRDFDYLTEEDIAAALLYAARASNHRVIRVA
jgi:uncharacterized protein (DUF433 family)